MAETEKITINLGPVDLGRIDVLVEQGLYSNRTDLIRTAIRNLLDRHEPVVQELATRRSFVLGTMSLDRHALEEALAEGKRLSMNIIGSLQLADDIDEDLARAAIRSITVRGVFRAPQRLKEALADRTKS